MKNTLNFALAALLAAAAGCASSSNDAARTSVATETCYVCQYNNDLACVHVKVKETTPRTEYQGTTYYFCSDECRAAFLLKPRKYLPKG